MQLRTRRLPLSAEVALSILAAVAAFAVAGVVCAAARHSHVPGLVLGLALLAVVLAIARTAGIMYALPVGVVATEAYDWFFLPPLRTLDAGAFSVLGLLIAMAVIVGAVTTTIARNAVESERARGNLADEQAALRRVATLVAAGARPSEVFQAVADELARLLGADSSFVARLDDSDPAKGEEPRITIVGSYGRLTAATPVGTRVALEEGMMMRTAVDTGRAASLSGAGLQIGPFGAVAADLGLNKGISTPVMVGSRLWGVVVVGTNGDFQPGAESRIADFIELAAIAIANTEADEQLRELADTQASLRRLALLIAQGEQPERVFAAVTKEVLRQFGDEGGTARLLRYELDGTATLLANEGSSGPHVVVGGRWEIRPHSGLFETVRRTGRPARVDDYRTLPGGSAFAREGLVSAVGVPVHVNGRLWGLIAVGTSHDRLAPDLEARLTEFTDLVATAVADAQSRAELTNSRARIVAASDETRRRIERDLHDGVQQSLVTLALRLRTAASDLAIEGKAGAEGQDGEELADVATGLMTVIDELRELSRGIHPAVLSDSGLRPALRALARRAPVPMNVEVHFDERLTTAVEVGAYYVVSEMLTNAVKHADASTVDVDAEVTDCVLTLRVHDDGTGGADPERGTGLLGLKDRIEALGGRFDVHSPVGGGTTVICRIPTCRPA
ncbi:GAF domain-containing protein [Actinoplanes sp. TBRC 11911]|uniref:GAF domain-containing protein n=1 Tax=Actinoplanes sp. TBRC 11911 TaxID=2729386 RepID=UPI00145F50DC|nr:GAF domain-containing protein [Actinoplanes sp. TBRC 11911]NMO55150.1 GAF domain-containing protein [Actinoplanes sp. TBRC 11911]